MNVKQALRFGVVGIAQNALNVGVFATLLAAGTGYGLAAVVALIAALGFSFALNRRWTFAAAAADSRRQLRRYSLVYLTACGAGVALLAAFVEIAGWRPVPAQVASILVVAPLSYLAQRAYAFEPS